MVYHTLSFEELWESNSALKVDQLVNSLFRKWHFECVGM
jgi:hypothetical protein